MLQEFNASMKVKNELLDQKLQQLEYMQQTMESNQTNNTQLETENDQLKQKISEFEEEKVASQKKYGELLLKHNKYIELDL